MFTKATLKFLEELTANNNRTWFEMNKPRYDSLVRKLAIEDLKRKNFIGIAPLSQTEVTGAGLVKLASTRFAASVPFMKFLCEAVKVNY